MPPEPYRPKLTLLEDPTEIDLDARDRLPLRFVNTAKDP